MYQWSASYTTVATKANKGCQRMPSPSPHAATVLPAGLGPQSLEPLAHSEMPQPEPPALLPTQNSPNGVGMTLCQTYCSIAANSVAPATQVC